MNFFLHSSFLRFFHPFLWAACFLVSSSTLRAAEEVVRSPEYWSQVRSGAIPFTADDYLSAVQGKDGWSILAHPEFALAIRGKPLPKSGIEAIYQLHHRSILQDQALSAANSGALRSIYFLCNRLGGEAIWGMLEADLYHFVPDDTIEGWGKVAYEAGGKGWHSLVCALVVKFGPAKREELRKRFEADGKPEHLAFLLSHAEETRHLGVKGIVLLSEGAAKLPPEIRRMQLDLLVLEYAMFDPARRKLVDEAISDPEVLAHLRSSIQPD